MIEYLQKLGFKTNGSRSKYQIDIYGYEIILEKVDKEWTVNYGKKIKIHHAGVNTLTKEEYWVQLECVVSLLLKGYLPQNIELEKTYKLGHNDSGRLDVLINDLNGNAWAMIECKTFGLEYEKERNKTVRNGGQIISYFAQDRKAKVLSIYSSKYTDEGFERNYFDILTDHLDIKGNVADIHKSWNKITSLQILFDDESSRYDLGKKNIKKYNLVDLNKDTGRTLFLKFLELLRKHVVSDKSNAFNVIFNVFVCKIYDEDRKKDKEDLDVQLRVGDDFETLLKRISEVYIKAVKGYLGLDFDDAYLISIDDNKIALKEFSFIEIFNKESFEKNAQILVELIQIIQKFRIKYSTRHQFLGDFFENLLTTGVKQESGQFFTPVPLARFILRSIPIEQIIEDKTTKGEAYILPHVIDYACGSGHFLTESIEEIQACFSNISDEDLTGQQQRYFSQSKSNYLWARDYIYGIEKDYRLAKTAKIAMFMNGDGDATIINSDGLGDFYKNEAYKGILKSSKPCKSISQFDIVVSNPPFSVDGFQNEFENADDSFDLASALTEKSTEIECFFIERTWQLLREGGFAGIILPLSILSNDKSLYVLSRKLIVTRFQIHGLVELREKAFPATNTSVAIIILRKRNRSEYEIASKNVLKNMGKEATKTININNEIDNLLVISEDEFNEFQIALIDELLSKEKLIVGFSGENKKQEHFLGYRTSKARGREGVFESDESLLSGKNRDDKKSLAFAIRQMCTMGKMNASLDDCYKEYAEEMHASNVIKINDDGGYDILTPSSIMSSSPVVVEEISILGRLIDEFPGKKYKTSIENLIKLNKVEICKGLGYDKNNDELPTKTKTWVLTASNIDLKTGRLVFGKKLVYLKDTITISNDLLVKPTDIIMSMNSGSLGHLGKVAIVRTSDIPANTRIAAGGFLTIIKVNDPALSKALLSRFHSKVFREFIYSKKGQNINNLNVNDLKSYEFELPVSISDFEKAYDKETKNMA